MSTLLTVLMTLRVGWERHGVDLRLRGTMDGDGESGDHGGTQRSDV
jgi:hypothetical protein